MLDRPLVIFDAPQLTEAARITRTKSPCSRGAAVVGRTASRVAALARQELAAPRRLSRQRRRVVGEMFHDLGNATARSIAVIDDLLSGRGRRRRTSARSTAARSRAVMTRSSLDATVLIATFNRATLLDETLRSIRELRVSPNRRWDVIVVDNNSTDDTRDRGGELRERFSGPPAVSLRGAAGTLERPECGILASAGNVIAFTDDDVLVESGWLDAACDELSTADSSIGYVGGPVRPIWEAPPPAWLKS